MTPAAEFKDVQAHWLLHHYAEGSLDKSALGCVDDNDIASYAAGRLPLGRAALLQQAMTEDHVLADAVAHAQQAEATTRRTQRWVQVASVAAVLLVAVGTWIARPAPEPWSNTMQRALAEGNSARISELVREAEAEGALRDLGLFALGHDIAGQPYSSPAADRKPLVLRGAADEPTIVLPRGLVTTAVTHFSIANAPARSRIRVFSTDKASHTLLEAEIRALPADLVQVPSATEYGERLAAEIVDADGTPRAFCSWSSNAKAQAQLDATLRASALLLPAGPARQLATANAYLHHGFAAEAVQILQSSHDLADDPRARRTLEFAREEAGLLP
jgi:hypothetical protein